MEFIQEMKEKLLNMKREILSNLMQEHEEIKEIMDAGKSPRDLVEIASDDLDRKILETLGSYDHKRLNLIDAAIGRIENNTYGKCLKTGRPISRARLEALPYALYCIEVQEALDKNKKFPKAKKTVKRRRRIA